MWYGAVLLFLQRERINKLLGIDVSRENIEFIKENIDFNANVEVMNIKTFLDKSQEDGIDVVIFNDVIKYLFLYLLKLFQKLEILFCILILHYMEGLV